MRLRSRLLAAVFAVAAMGLSAPAVSAQDDGPSISQDLSDEIQILSVSVDDGGIAELIVAIPPAIGEVAPASSDFAVVQNGEKRPVLVGELKDEVDVALVIDTSGSMRGQPLASAKAAALEFVEAMPEGSRVGVIGFGATPLVASDLTTDRRESSAAISRLAARGETALWDAMIAAGVLLDSEARSAPYIVVLSDGGDTASSAALADAVGALSETKNRIGLYVVTLETAESDHSALNSAATQLAGQVLSTTDSESLQELYVEIAGRLSSRYSIRFEAQGLGEVTLSVAVDGSIATARTTLGDDGTPALIATDSLADSSEAATEALVPVLGTVTIGDPGFIGSNQMLWIGAGSAFAGLIVLFTMLAIPAMKVQPIESIRGIDAAGRAEVLNKRMSGAADRLIRSHDSSGSLDKTLDAAGLEIRAGEFVVMFGILLLSVGGVAAVTWGSLGAIFAIAMAALGGFAFVTMRVTRRRNAFADQLQNTISIMTGSLRAGRGVPQAIEMVAQEAPSPTSEEFRRVVIETRVGRDPIVSLQGVAERMSSLDLEWIAQAIAVNRELGGDLIELLENVARTVRDRNRIELQVRALSAEGRISGWVMLSLPVLMYLYLQFVNPEYIALLHTTNGGRVAGLAGITAMIGGTVWIRKLVNIRF